MLIKHNALRSHQMPIFLNIQPRNGRSVPAEDASMRPTLNADSVARLDPGATINVTPHDVFDPFFVGLFKAGIVSGDLAGEQSKMSDKRDETQRESDAQAASRAASSELRERDEKLKNDESANSNLSKQLEDRQKALDERERGLTDREEKINTQAQTAGDGLGWTAGGVEPMERAPLAAEAPETKGDVSMADETNVAAPAQAAWPKPPTK